MLKIKKRFTKLLCDLGLTRTLLLKEGVQATLTRLDHIKRDFIWKRLRSSGDTVSATILLFQKNFYAMNFKIHGTPIRAMIYTEYLLDILIELQESKTDTLFNCVTLLFVGDTIFERKHKSSLEAIKFALAFNIAPSTAILLFG